MSKITTLSQICDALSDGLHKAPVFNPTGEYLFVNATNLEKGYIVDKDEGKRADFSEYQKYGVELNDRTILYSIDGTIGNIARYRGEKVILGKGACYLMVKNGVDPDYIYFLLQSEAFNEYIRKMSTGSTIHHISLETMRNFKFQLPDYDTQKSISSVLMAMENKIHLNVRLAAELESMAKTIYDYWFTQFDFPDADGKPYRSSGGAMEWNEQLKCNVPYGWSAVRLGDVCTFRNGINYEKGCQGNRTYRIVNVRNITASNYLMDVSDFDKISLPREQADRYVLGEHDIIIARSGTPGATRLIMNPVDNIIFCGFIICCTPIVSEYRLFISQYLKKLEGTNATKTGGSILQNVSQDTLKSLLVCLPNKATVEAFNAQIMPLIAKMDNIIRENRELTKLRDWLLPMLMNGQATVADAKEKVSKVIPFTTQTVEVRQAARNFGDKKTDDTADLVKAFMRRKKNDSKA